MMHNWVKFRFLFCLMSMGGEHSRKDPFEQLISSYSEHLHMSARPVENARDNTLILKHREGSNSWNKQINTISFKIK